MRSIVRVQSISPRPQFKNFSRATVPLTQCAELTRGRVHGLDYYDMTHVDAQAWHSKGGARSGHVFHLKYVHQVDITIEVLCT